LLNRQVLSSQRFVAAVVWVFSTACGNNPGRGGAGAGGSAGDPNPQDAGGIPSDAGLAQDAAVSSPDSVWSPLSVMALVNPKDYGAIGNGSTDDLNALSAAVNALPDAGGIVYLPAGASFKKTNLLVISKAHVKVWAPNRQAEIFQSIAGQTRRQSIICRNNVGCGFFGLKLRSDAVARFDALEDNQISADHASLVEVVGCEVQGSAASGIFLYGSSEHYLEGNYIHHTFADHVHHTQAASRSWVWNNFIFNEAPSKGDDGVACVTYGPKSPPCQTMEWWRNTILHTDWGRGYAVIGGSNINIHHNWAIGVAGAGVIVASESSYNSASSDGIRIANNYVSRCGHSIGHPGILVSGENSAAEPLRNITLLDNVVADTVTGTAYRSEGAFSNVSSSGLLTTNAALPKPTPTNADIRMVDTSVLRTRDVSHVEAGLRRGLYRIHVRKSAIGTGFQQRFEYVVKGPPATMAAFMAVRNAAGDHISEQRTQLGTTYALLLSSVPYRIPDDISGVSFQELRAGDLSTQLSWLWQRLDSEHY
jgi:hypothetical protein